MPFTFKRALKAFKDNQIRLLSNDEEGKRFLKLRSISRKDQMTKLFEAADIPVPEVNSKQWLRILYESNISDEQIEDVINNLYEEERQTRRQNEDVLVSELYKLGAFDWGGLHQNSLEKTIIDNYVKKIQSFDVLNDRIENEIHNSMRAYVQSSWYNHWTSIIIEDVVKDHPSVLPAVGLIKKIDFFINDVPFDLKVTYLPEGFIKDKRKDLSIGVESTLLKRFCRSKKIHYDNDLPESKLLPDLWAKISDHPSPQAGQLIYELREFRINTLDETIEAPEELVRWLYENQGIRRFDASNRMFLVLVDYNNFFESWKLKRAKALLTESINNHLDNIENHPGFNLEFNWEGQTFTVTSDVIFVTHNN